MVTEELRQYITAARAAGIHPDAIRAELRQAGWADVDLTEAIVATQTKQAPEFNPVLVSKNSGQIRLIAGVLIVGLVAALLGVFVYLLYF